jgi:uncharacterized protein with ParB-like and HNH nuclease domain
MNSENTFGEFIKSNSFVIPDYQRAYSWEDKQLIPFLNDILEHCDDNDNPSDDTRYYLGHYILEKSKGSDIVEIVDGQQRICTVYLFLMVCGHLDKTAHLQGINFKPVSYDKAGLDEIKSIFKRENIDEELEKILENPKATASLKRMV